MPNTRSRKSLLYFYDTHTPWPPPGRLAKSVTKRDFTVSGPGQAAGRGGEACNLNKSEYFAGRNSGRRGQMTKEERKIIGVTSAGHGLNHGFILVFSAVLPMLQEVFQAGYFQLGMIGNICFLAYGLGSLPSGILTDVLGPKRLVGIFLFGAALSSFLIALSHSLFLFGLFLGLLGLFCSTYHPASNTLISRGLQKQGKGFGIHGISGGLGIALTPVAAGFFASALGWKAAYVIFGLIGIAVGIASLTLPEVAQKSPEGDAKGSDTTGGELKFSLVPLIIFFTTTAMLGLCYRGVLTFLPAYMAKSVQIGFLPISGVALGGMMATIALLFGTIGQYVGGTLSDRYLPEKVYFCVHLFGIPFLFLIGFSTNIFVVLFAIVYAFFHFATQPLGVRLLARYTSESFRGTGYGVHFLLNFGVGSFSATLSGYLADLLGLEWVFYSMGFVFFISGVLSLTLLILAQRVLANSPIQAAEA